MHPLAVGTRIEKTNSEPEDVHHDGSRGEIVGMVGPCKVPGIDSLYGYFIKWDDVPNVTGFTIAKKIRPQTGGKQPNGI